MDQAAATRPCSFFGDLWDFFRDLFFGDSEAEKEFVSKVNSLTQSVREFRARLGECVTEDDLKAFANAVNTRLDTLDTRLDSLENCMDTLDNKLDKKLAQQAEKAAQSLTALAKGAKRLKKSKVSGLQRPLKPVLQLPIPAIAL